MKLDKRRALVALCGGVVGAFLATSATTDQTPGTNPCEDVPPASGFARMTSESPPLAAPRRAAATVAEPAEAMLLADISGMRQAGCQSGTAPSCSGACPPFNTCQAIRIRSLEICNCVGERAVCGTADPLCGGVCPGGLVCAGDVFGFGSCQCEQSLPTVVTTTRPVMTTTTTSVAPVLPLPCAASEYPECGGACPRKEACVAHVDRGAWGNCECFSVDSGGGPCSDARVPQCDGTCPSGTTCMGDGTRCVCFDVFGATCGFFGPPECAGACPPATPVCREDGAGGCVCAP